MQYKAHDYPEVYESLGIDLKTLGCVMLKTEEPDTSFIADEDLYVSPDPAKFWIKGRASGNSHVTLRYGLLPSVRQEHVRRIMDDVNLPRQLFVDHLEMFPTTYDDEPYECIVARVTDSQGELKWANDALSLLPNINTFSGYKPHVTLAYVKQGWWMKNWQVARDAAYVMQPMRTKGLDMGRMKP